MATSKNKKAVKKAATKKRASNKPAHAARGRTARPYPASSFSDALTLGDAIMRYASGDKVRRLTLLQQMNKSPTSGTTKQMITNSGKYGITNGSYAAEYLELTDMGRSAVNSSAPLVEQRKAAFDLAVAGVAPFKVLYEHYKDKRLPEREIMKDVLLDSAIEVPDLDECVDTFTVNVKNLDLLRTIGGAETLVSIEQALEELTKDGSADRGNGVPLAAAPPMLSVSSNAKKGGGEQTKSLDWSKICFYITPIGSEDSQERKHSDLFMASLVQPALEELGLTVVRADGIGEAGMITSQILEYLKRSRLAIADLSYLNPNVFYEVALRHALRLPVVQIIRKADRLPFDVNQARTLVFDTSDIYSLVPKLQTYRAEIATQARKALDDPESVGNPVSVFYPDFYS